MIQGGVDASGPEAHDIAWLNSIDWRHLGWPEIQSAAKRHHATTKAQRSWVDRPGVDVLIGAAQLQLVRQCFDTGSPIPNAATFTRHNAGFGPSASPKLLERIEEARISPGADDVVLDEDGNLPGLMLHLNQKWQPEETPTYLLHWLVPDGSFVERGQIVGDIRFGSGLSSLPRHVVAGAAGTLDREFTDDILIVASPGDWDEAGAKVCSIVRPTIPAVLGDEGMVFLHPDTAPGQVVEHAATPGDWYKGVTDGAQGSPLLTLQVGQRLVDVTSPVDGILVDLRPLGHPVRGGDVIARVTPSPEPAPDEPANAPTPGWIPAPAPVAASLGPRPTAPASVPPPATGAPSPTASASNDYDDLVQAEMRRLRGELG